MATLKSFPIFSQSPRKASESVRGMPCANRETRFSRGLGKIIITEPTPTNNWLTGLRIFIILFCVSIMQPSFLSVNHNLPHQSEHGEFQRFLKRGIVQLPVRHYNVKV